MVEARQIVGQQKGAASDVYSVTQKEEGNRSSLTSDLAIPHAYTDAKRASTASAAVENRLAQREHKLGRLDLKSAQPMPEPSGSIARPEGAWQSLGRCPP